MFSWSKKASSKKKSRSSAGNPAFNDFGIPITREPDDEELEAELRAVTGVMSIEDEPEFNDEGSDVEAELLKIIGGTKGKKKKKSQSTNESRDVSDLNVNVGIMNINDEDIADDEDVDVDEDDPELLGELMDLMEETEDEDNEPADDVSTENQETKKVVTVTSVLVDRLNMYREAEAKAKANNESARARRFARGIKTLQQLIKKAEAGQPVLPSEIPPVIATNLKPAPPAPPPLAVLSSELDMDNYTEGDSAQSDVQPSDETPEHSINVAEDTKDVKSEESTDLDNERKNSGTDLRVPSNESEEENRVVEAPPAAEENPLVILLRSRREEYKASALQAKRDNDLDTALKHVKCVKKLNELIATVELGEDVNESEIPPTLSRPKRPPAATETVTPLKFEAPADIEEYEIPTTTLEALNQRLGIYKTLQEKAERVGDEAGSRRNHKTVQVYTEAIKLHKAGKKVPLTKLPTPPGCPPIPIPFEVE